MWNNSTTIYWDKFHQRKYITEYEIVFKLDGNNPNRFLEHLEKVCRNNPGIEDEILSLYDLLRIYGLLYDTQTAYQIETLPNHPYDPQIEERWRLFRRHNTSDASSVHELNAIVIDDMPTVYKKDLRHRGEIKLLISIKDSNWIWDDSSLTRFRKKHGDLQFLPPFIRGKPRWEGKDKWD